MGAGVSLQLKAPIGEMVEHAMRLDFSASNIEAEYEAILARIDLAQSVLLEKLLICNDSQLVAGQVNEEYETRDQCMAKYMGLVKQRLRNFAAWKLKHITWDSNERVDALVAVTTSIPIKETIFLPIYFQSTSSIATDRISQIDEIGPS